MASIEVSLSDFDDDDIIDYVIDNIDIFYPRQVKQLKTALGNDITVELDFINTENLSDIMKIEFIAEIFNKYTLEQLEEKLK